MPTSPFVRSLDTFIQSADSLPAHASSRVGYALVPDFGTIVFGGVVLLLLVIVSVARWHRYRRRPKSGARAA
jgi:hypothetical protein